MWFTGSGESVVIFNPITPNVNFVETYISGISETSGIKHKYQLYILHVCCAYMYNLTLNYVKSFTLVFCTIQIYG